MCELLDKDYFLTALGDPRPSSMRVGSKTKEFGRGPRKLQAYTPSTTVFDGMQTDTGRGRVQKVEGCDDNRLKQLEKELANHRHQIQQLKADR